MFHSKGRSKEECEDSPARSADTAGFLKGVWSYLNLLECESSPAWREQAGQLARPGALWAELAADDLQLRNILPTGEVWSLTSTSQMQIQRGWILLNYSP